MENYQLDSMDEQILGMLIRNARTPFLEIARACGVSGTAIHQRVQRLTSLGIIQGTEYKIDPTRISPAPRADPFRHFSVPKSQVCQCSW